jgi:hypothetical protein
MERAVRSPAPVDVPTRGCRVTPRFQLCRACAFKTPLKSGIFRRRRKDAEVHSHRPRCTPSSSTARMASRHSNINLCDCYRPRRFLGACAGMPAVRRPSDRQRVYGCLTLPGERYGTGSPIRTANKCCAQITGWNSICSRMCDRLNDSGFSSLPCAHTELCAT